MKRILLIALLVVGCGTNENAMGPAAQKTTNPEQTPEELRNYWIDYELVGEWSESGDHGGWLVFNMDHTWVKSGGQTYEGAVTAYGGWQVTNGGRNLDLHVDKGKLAWGWIGGDFQGMEIQEGEQATASISLGRSSLTIRIGDKQVVLFRRI